MSDEENEAIEWLKRLVKINKRDNLNDTFAERLLNLIEKQSKEIEEYKKQLDLDYVDKNFIRIDKIKAKIEELKEDEKREMIVLNPSAKDGCVTNVSHEEEIKVLQSLLERK